MNIKLSTFKSRLKHSAEFEAETAGFLQNIEIGRASCRERV